MMPSVSMMSMSSRYGVSSMTSVRYWMMASRFEPSSTSAWERIRTSRSRCKKNRSIPAPTKNDFSSRLVLRVSKSTLEVVWEASR